MKNTRAKGRWRGLVFWLAGAPLVAAMGNEVVNTIVAGSVAGIASTLVCHPLDTVRTRMQTAAVNEFKDTRSCAHRILTEEGWRSFYRGLTGPLLAQAVYKSVIFTSNSRMRELIAQRRQGGVLTSLDSAVCGAVSGGINAGVVTPVELIRNTLMTDVNRRFRGPAAVVRHIVQSQGLLGLWRGLSATLLRDTAGMAAYFLCYFETKKMLARGTLPLASHAILAAALAGTGYWVVALPLDTIKSRVQGSQLSGGGPKTGGKVARPRASIADEIVGILRTKGVAGFFSGWPAAFGRGVPGAIVTLTVYDSMLSWLQS